ncbi:hypothetical protein LXL04_003962 [Taraxacum kok-saghyz]
MASDSSTSSSTVNSLPLTTTSLTLVNFPSSLKLSSTNYLSWKTQIEALLHGLDLYKFINGTHLPPKPTATNGVSTPHADYPAWFRQDRLLFGALVGTLSPALVPLVSSAATSLEAWTILSNTYAKPSRGHIKQLQHRLKQTSKTSDQSVTEYMQSIKAIVDELSILGKPMDQEDVTDAILIGLDSNSYKSVIESIHARDTPIPFTELHEKLINHELSLIQNQPIPTSIHQPSTVFVAHKNYPSKPWNNRSTSNQNPILPTPPQYPTNNNTTARPFLGKCQFCFSKGHSLIQCYAFKNKYPQIHLPSYPKTTYNNNPQAHVVHTINNGSGSNQTWLFDSGASHHITSDLSNLSLHNAYDGTDELVIGDGSSLAITHIGSLCLRFSHTAFTLKNVLCVPSISKNIISISRLCIDNFILIQFYSFYFFIKDFKTKQILLQGMSNRGVYELRSTSPHLAFLSNKSIPWHHRLGHPHFQVLQHLASIVPAISSLKNNCNSCCINKSHKLPFHVTAITTTKPLELIFSDVWTSPILSIDEYKYYIIFVDHFTKYTWLYPLKHKSDSLNTFTRFQKLVENFFQLKIKQLFSDNGGEYVKMSSHLSSCGISHLTSPPHTPEHNGYAERRHRHITYAVTTATYLINRLPTKTLNNKSPYLCLFKKQPNYDKLRSFGCLAYPWLRPYTKHKLESRSKPCIFVSYSSSQSAYHLLDPLTNKIHTSRHVYFVESEFPYNSLTNTTPTNTPAPDSWLQLSLIPLPNPSTNIPPEIPSLSPQNTIPPSSTTIPPGKYE